MKNITDYIKKQGALSFEALPFNEVDSLILSQLSYLKYDGLIPAFGEDRPGIPLREIPEAEGYDGLFADKRYARMNRALFAAAAASTRFGGMKLNNYVSILEEGWELQFSAMTFSPENSPLYIAYRGTDETLVGWKEDFNMALFLPIPAQKKALQYLNGIASITHGKFVIGGHSKGGNLAVYAAATCAKRTADRILTVYNHDGPGFPRGTLMETPGFLAIRDKIKKYIPHSSVVGMLMESHEPYEVVECRSFGILQHDPFNWIVNGTAFKRVEDVYAHVSLQNDAINEWIDGMSDTERRVFVDTLYDVMTASGAQTLLDIMSDWKTNSKAMLDAIEKCDPMTREMLKLIFSHLFTSLQENMWLKVEEIIPKPQHFVKSASDEHKKL